MAIAVHIVFAHLIATVSTDVIASHSAEYVH